MKRGLAAGAISMLTMFPVMAQSPAPEVLAVALVNFERYSGKWFEIARFPNRFQTQCVANVTAEYRLREAGGIDVINRCQKKDGTYEQAIGFGKVPDPASNARLKVRFAPGWLSWLPLVWGDYWILALAPDYSWAVVGDPKREYLWILARTPILPDVDYQSAVKSAAAQGFDVSRLIRTRQEM